MAKVECFKIRLLFQDVGIKEIDLNKVLLDIYFDRRYFMPNPVIIVADPFLFVYKKTLYLFYEEKRLLTPGVLRMIMTHDLKTWTSPVTVLHENIHLSYPYVFENEGKVYMVPETGAGHYVGLYEAANENLTSFTLRKKLLIRKDMDISIGNDYADSSIHQVNGIYYLFTTVQRNGVNELELYYSDTLEGDYVAHSGSPVCRGQKYGRNGGGLIQKNGKLYRIAQDCVEHYGDNVHVLEVKQLNKDSYKEKQVEDSLYPITHPFYCRGGHHLNTVTFQNQQIIATDAKEYRNYVLVQAIQLKNRIISLIKK